MKNLLFSVVYMLMLFGITACGSDENNASPAKYDVSDNDLRLNETEGVVARLPYWVSSTGRDTIPPSPKVDLAKKCDLPSWLVEKIENWEESDPAKTTAVYHFMWDDEGIYFVYNMLQSSLFSNCFNDEDGSSARHGSVNGHLQELTNWRLVYCTDTSQWIKINRSEDLFN